MVGDPAVACRRYQFVAGPESMTFNACAQHQPELERAWTMSDLFFQPRESYTIEPIAADDEIECDYCRGEHGP